MWFPGRRIFLLAGLVALSALLYQKGLAQSLSAVPGAAGFGMQTRAAYGCGGSPAVLRVTNRNDSGAGSLRAALEASGPRVVIFEVSGYISLESEVYVTSPCLTVAGQTAPSPGITVRGSAGYGDYSGEGDYQGIYISTHDVLIQHLRFRMGGGSCNSGLVLYPSGFYNIVFDHVSVSWAQDEGAVVTSGTSLNGGNVDVTFWRSIFSEGLLNTPGAERCAGGQPSHAHGLAIGDGAVRVAVMQNLFAHILERSPALGQGSRTYIANNVNYNTHEGVFMGGPATFQHSVIGNYFKRGPTSRDDYVFRSADAPVGAQLYETDNTIDDGGLSPAMVPWLNPSGIDPRVGTPPIAAPAGYAPITSAAALPLVLAKAGARPTDRDAVDNRVVASVHNRTGNIISHQDDVGGYPALATNTRSLMVPANPHRIAATGYTNLETWLHGFASALEGGPPQLAEPPVPVPTNLQIVRD
jgi:hypothetical protein